MTAIATARLALSPVQAADVSELHRIFVMPGVRRFLFDDEMLTFERTAALIEESTRLAREEGTGLWGSRFHSSPDLVGFSGLWYFREPPERELVFAVADGFVGQGLATEMARAMLRHGFERLGYAEITGSTDVANTASARVMEKAGMHLVRRETVAGLDTIFYAASPSDSVIP